MFGRPKNIARDGLDILFHFSNDWYKISRVKSKKLKSPFCLYQKYTKIAIFAILVYFWYRQKFDFDFFDLALNIFVPIVRGVERDV